jgi:uncharacterized protein YndB with AHSA1/START domain
MRVFLLSMLALLGSLPQLRADDNRPEEKALDPTLRKMAEMIGGVWTNDDPRFRVEFRYQWAFNESALRGIGLIDKGGPGETPVEATFGWDPHKKSVYYLDVHGGKTIYKGTVHLDNSNVILEFATLVGPPAKWRSVGTFPDKDSYRFTIYREKDGKWTPVVKQLLKRRPVSSDESCQITEGIVPVPRDAVWSAFTTKEGQEAWNVAHAEIDLKIGGTMRTHYDAKGQIGDRNTIENIILAFEPQKMLAIKVGKAPERFPFKHALGTVWHVMYFEDAGPGRTRLRIVGLGYGGDEESKKLRAFFEKGNAYTLRKLEEHFKKRAEKRGGVG